MLKQRISYLFVKAGVFVIRLVPMQVLYLISNGISFLFNYVVRYRNKVIYKNLKGAFPSKTEVEIKQLQKSFYSYLADMLLETVKGFSMSLDDIKIRVIDPNPSFMQDVFKKNHKVLMVMGHYGNFEWLCRGLPYIIPNCEHICLYQPVRNPILDEYIKLNRERYGMKMISVKDMKALIQVSSNKKKQCFWFVMDQVPGAPHESAHWMEFLNQDTPVIYGPEKFAKKLDAAVVYTELQQEQRGYYSLAYQTITEFASKTKPFEITEKEMKELEAGIIRQPKFWLWSHNRWKHQRRIG